MQLNIQLNEAEKKFFVIVDDKEAKVDFVRPSDSVLDLIHVYVPPSLRNQGIAGALAKFVLSYAKEHALKIIPTCPYIAHYLRIHPEWAHLVA
jgi:predicted GNAT family acetyltransferase